MPAPGILIKIAVEKKKFLYGDFEGIRMAARHINSLSQLILMFVGRSCSLVDLITVRRGSRGGIRYTCRQSL